MCSKNFYKSIVTMALMMHVISWQACNKPVSDIRSNDEDVTINLKKKKVLLVVLDGVVGTAMEEMDLPTLKRMQENSVYSYYGLIDTLTNDGTTWADVLTGTRLNKHNVKTENFSGANFTQYPNFLKRLKDNDAGFRAVTITTLPLLATGVFGSEVEKHIHLPNNDVAAKDSAVRRLATDDAGLLLVDFSAAHRAGKSYGYTTGALQYRQALQTIDDYIDEMVYTLQHRDSYPNEDWMVVVTSTHGGKADGTYGGNTGAERNTFSFYYNPKLKKTAIARPLVNIPYEGNFIRFNVENGVQRHAYVNNPAYSFGASQNFTVELRVKTNNTTSNDPVLISNKNWANGGNIGWGIFKLGSIARLNFRASGSTTRRDLNSPAFTDDKWHMLSASFDRNGLLSFYMDGVLVSSASLATLPGTIDAGFPLVIGEHGPRNYYTSYGIIPDTYISDVRIWNTALPADIINSWQYISPNSSHPMYANLVGYWKMNEPTGSILKDYSKTGADLFYTGTAARPLIAAILNPSSVDTRILTPGLVDHSFRIMTWLGKRVDYQAWGLDGKVWSGN